MRRAFVTHEFLNHIALIAVAISLCLPVVAAIKSSHMSLIFGGTLIIAICLLFLLPSVCLDRANRRKMKELDSKSDQSDRR